MRAGKREMYSGTAVVTDVHYRMSLAVLRDLREAGVRVVACESDRYSTKQVVGFASRCACETRVLRKSDYLEDLYRLCEEWKQAEGVKPALLPVGAGTLALLAEPETQKRFSAVCGLCLPTPEQLSLLNDKRRVAELADRLGIPTPKAFQPDPEESVESFAQRLSYPCAVKPECGEKFGIPAAGRYRIAKTPEVMTEAFRRFQTLTGEVPVVQEYLPGGGLGCSVLAVEGKVILSLCHRRLREYPVSGGPSSCCVSIAAPELEAYAARLVEAVGFTGLAMVEFKENRLGNPVFLEVNPRVWGSYPLTRGAGAPFSCAWYLCAAKGQKGMDELSPFAIKIGKKLQFALSDFAAAVGYTRAGQPGQLFSVLADFCSPAVCGGVWEWSDPKPALCYLRSQLMKGGRS